MTPEDLPPLKPGDPPRVGPHNKYFGDVERLSRRNVGGGLEMTRDSITLDASQEFTALLGGALGTGTSPYAFDEAYMTAGGTYAVLPGGRSGTAHDFNGKAGLGGLPVTTMRLINNEYRFYVPRKGTTCVGSLRVLVLGCGKGLFAPWNGVRGATVTFLQSGITYTPTSVSGEFYTFATTSSTPGVVTVSKSRYVTQTFNHTPHCYADAKTVRLLAAPGYSCCPEANCDPFPDTLHLTDPNTTITLAKLDPSHGVIAWTGSYPWTQAGYNSGSCTPSYSVVGAVGYVLNCYKAYTFGSGSGLPSGNYWKLDVYWTSCRDFFFNFGPGSANAAGSWDASGTRNIPYQPVTNASDKRCASVSYYIPGSTYSCVPLSISYTIVPFGALAVVSGPITITE